MGYDYTVTKGYGFTVPLAHFHSDFDRIAGKIRRSHRKIKIGTSGSSTITGIDPQDVIWVAPNRLVKSEKPVFSQGFLWSFREEPTEGEKEALREIAVDIFGLDDVPPIEPFVALEVL